VILYEQNIVGSVLVDMQIQDFRQIGFDDNDGVCIIVAKNNLLL
jgi:hypothetical protein